MKHKTFLQIAREMSRRGSVSMELKNGEIVAIKRIGNKYIKLESGWTLLLRDFMRDVKSVYLTKVNP